MREESMIGFGVIILAALMGAVFGVVVTKMLAGPSQVTPTPTPTETPMAKDRTLTVVVTDDGDSWQIQCHGDDDGNVNLGTVAFAAAWLTAKVCMRCPDGFERGLEHIQADAMKLGMQRWHERKEEA